MYSKEQKQKQKKQETAGPISAGAQMINEDVCYLPKPIFVISDCTGMLRRQGSGLNKISKING